MKPAAVTPWAQVEALGASVAELAAFQDEPLQMRSGTVGKTGFLHLGFERRGSRTVLADLDRRSPYMVQRALYCDQTMPDLATVFLITTTGCLLQGDRLALNITLGPRAKAHITSQSATKIHAMDANYAAQTQIVTLADEAYLEFLPDPVIPHRHARFVSDTQIIVPPSATLVFSEIIQSGRKHHHPDECFGATLISISTSASRPDGRSLFIEKLVIEPRRYAMRRTGVMDSFDVFGNVILCTPKDRADRIRERVDADVDLAEGVAFGACRLPNDAGLIYKVLGRETAQVKAKVREFWGVVREEITGTGLPSAIFLALAGQPRPQAVSNFADLHVEEAVMEKVLARWEGLCASSGVLRFVDINLRGIGQVMLQDNPLTGALFLTAIAWGSYAAGVPQVAIAGVIAVVVATLTAQWLRVDEASLNAGLYGFNAILVGLALATFLAPGPLLWVYVILGAAVSVVVMLATTNVVKPWGGALTFPFVLTTWLLLLATYGFSGLVGTALPSDNVVTAFQPYQASPLQLIDLVQGVFQSVSQVFLKASGIAALLLLAGLAVNSLAAAAFALGGAILAVLTAHLFGAESELVTGGLLGFSPVLTAIALGTVFYQPSWRVVAYTALGTVFTVIAQAALNVALTPFAIPALTAPFVLVTWLFLLPRQRLEEVPAVTPDIEKPAAAA